MTSTMAANKVEIVRFEPAHGDYIADHMRLADRREIYYTACLSPKAAIGITVVNAVAAWTGLVDGVPAAIFGINRRTRLSEVAAPWLLGTPVMEQHPVRLMRQSQVYFDRMQRAFPLMENFALAENADTLRWLKWLGFDMQEPKPYGVFAAKFVRFGKGLTDVH